MLEDSNLDISDASIRLAKARLGVNTKNQAKAETMDEEKEKEAEIEAPVNASESIESIPKNVSVENTPDIDSVESVETEESTVTIESASKKYGAQAGAGYDTYLCRRSRRCSIR